MITRNVTVSLWLCVLGLASCTAGGVATPAPTTAPVPTSAMVVPVTTATRPVTPPASGTVTPPVPSGVAAQQEGAPVAILTGIRLQPGHKYRLSVTSSEGVAAFSGTWSQSAVGQDGLPGIKTGNLQGATPATVEIVPPVASVAKDWMYSASVSNKAGGRIILTILEIAP